VTTISSLVDNTGQKEQKEASQTEIPLLCTAGMEAEMVLTLHHESLVSEDQWVTDIYLLIHKTISLWQGAFDIYLDVVWTAEAICTVFHRWSSPVEPQKTLPFAQRYYLQRIPNMLV
jgi:hypothetical protein